MRKQHEVRPERSSDLRQHSCSAAFYQIFLEVTLGDSTVMPAQPGNPRLFFNKVQVDG